MIPLDRALISSYRLNTNRVAICSGLAAVYNASTWARCQKLSQVV